METQIIITTEPQLRAIIADAVSIAVREMPMPRISSKSTKISSLYIDFELLCLEFYPGIPESTVRQRIGPLKPNRKEGRRNLYLRSDVEAHINKQLPQ